MYIHVYYIILYYVPWCWQSSEQFRECEIRWAIRLWPFRTAGIRVVRIPGLIYIPQRGVQWKQGVVIYMILYTSLLYDTTPIHCTPLRLHPPLMNTQLNNSTPPADPPAWEPTGRRADEPSNSFPWLVNRWNSFPRLNWWCGFLTAKFFYFISFNNY